MDGKTFSDVKSRLLEQISEGNAINQEQIVALSCLIGSSERVTQEMASLMFDLNEWVSYRDENEQFATLFIETITEFLMGDCKSIGPYEAHWLMNKLDVYGYPTVPLCALMAHIRDKAAHIAEPLASHLAELKLPELQK